MAASGGVLYATPSKRACVGAASPVMPLGSFFHVPSLWHA
jgi:hypothetical protein